jgi:DNA-binding MarR family transcriptional regulator
MMTMEHQIDRIGPMMGKIHRAIRKELDNKFKEFSITPPQFEVLVLLWMEDGLLLSELGRKLSRDGPTITGVVDRMEKKQLVKRVRDEKDRRAIKIVLTTKGLKLKDKLMSLRNEIIDKTIGNFIPHELEQLEYLLTKIWSNLQNEQTGEKDAEKNHSLSYRTSLSSRAHSRLHQKEG